VDGLVRRSSRGGLFLHDLAGGDPELISDDDHHEKNIDAKSPKDGEFWAFEMAPGDGLFFCFDQLIVFEGGEDEILFCGEGLGLGFGGHGCFTLSWLGGFGCQFVRTASS
jgi:hypothetical protein